MDELEKLALMVKAEDEAAQKLWEAKRKTQDTVRDNVQKLMDSGVIKLTINRSVLFRLTETGRKMSVQAFR